MSKRSICKKCGESFGDYQKNIVGWCPSCRKAYKEEYQELSKSLQKKQREAKKAYWENHPEEHAQYLKERKEKTQKSLILKHGSLKAAQEARLEKQRKTLLEKYGVDNISKSPIFKERLQETYKNKLEGNPNFWEERREKSNQTKIERYGSLEEAYSKMADNVRATCLERYGVESYLSTEESKERHKVALEKNLSKNPDFWKDRKEKSNSTKINKYGSLEEAYNVIAEKQKATVRTLKEENPEWENNRREKIKTTCIEKYGVENPMQNEDVKLRVYQKNLQNHGGVYYTTTEDFKERVKKTCQEKYGTDTPLQNEEVKQKISKTKLQRYGDAKYNNREKQAKTIIERFGSWRNTKTDSQRESKRLQITQENMIKYREIDFSLKSFSYFEKDNKPYVKCLECGTEFELLIAPSQILTNLHCYNCKPFETSSGIEKIIRNKLEKEGIIGEYSNKTILKGKELDMYFPNEKIAIEYDGAFFHRWVPKEGTTIGGHSNKNYHNEKTDLCKNQGIHLIHIFDEELYNKEEIVFATLKRFFNKIDTKVFARRCSIRELDNTAYRNFLEDNHMQGYAAASVKLGLFHQENLVACMSFSKPRFSKEYEWELVRYCEERNTVVLGGKEKLLKYFEEKFSPKSIISYCDRRWFKGTSYVKMGFTFKESSSPNYKYFKPGYNKFYSRHQFQKHKLKTIENFMFDENLTEIENMIANGYSLIYDCGNDVYVKEYNA